MPILVWGDFFMHKNKKLTICLVGAVCGAVNGLFGSGGGLIAVPALKAYGFDVKKAHASSIAMTATFSMISVITYLSGSAVDISLALGFIPAGIIGALIGTILLRHISPVFLSRIFAIIMIYSGARLLI